MSLPSEEEILEFLAGAKNPVPTRDIARRLDVSKSSRMELRAFLKLLERRGQVERVRGTSWRLAEQEPGSGKERYSGTLSVNRKGVGFVRLDGESAQRLGDNEDVFISELDLADALDGDRVQVEVERIARRGPRGRVVQVDHRAHPVLVGYFQPIGKGRGEIVPRSPTIHRVVRVSGIREDLGVKAFDWVVVRIEQFTPVPEPLLGEIVERIGASHEKGIDVLLLLRDQGIVPEFPTPAEQEAEQLEVDWEKELSLREDVRHLPTATIDPATAKDFDDALSVVPLEGGGWRLWVHIADVTHFVTPGSLIDQEALERSTSVYPVDRVVPMLPERLSNDLCSLRPREDRLAMTAEMVVTANGDLGPCRFYSSVIHSNQRLTYEQAQAHLEGTDGASEALSEELREPLIQLRDCARALRKKRFARGALDLDIPERTIFFHESGEVSHLGQSTRFEAHMLVEDCMLAANEAVARFLRDKKAPTLYRIHEAADPEKLEQLVPVFRALDIPFRVSEKGTIRPSDLQHAIEALEKRRGGHILRRMVLRSLKQARYAPENLGHFGLASKCYCHFTSPIRRYPDVVVHRQLRALERETALVYQKDEDGGCDELVRLGEHTSARERRAEAAERESETIKAIEYLKQFEGDEFDGLICGVQPFGLFVELQPHGVEGLIPTRSLEDDRYDIDDLGIELVGRHSGRRLRLTDKVRVRLVRASAFEGEMDLELLEGGGLGRRPRKGRDSRKPFYQNAPKGRGKGKKGGRKGGGKR